MISTINTNNCNSIGVTTTFSINGTTNNSTITINNSTNTGVFSTSTA